MKIKLISSDDLNFVEFSFSSPPDGFEVHSEKSRYLHSAVFCLFQNSFELSSNVYEYYGPTPYQGTGIIKLRNNLLEQIPTDRPDQQCR